MNLTERIQELAAWCKWEAETQRYAATLTENPHGPSSAQASRLAAARVYDQMVYCLGQILRDMTPPPALAFEGSFRQGRHNPCNIWLDPESVDQRNADGDICVSYRPSGKQMYMMFDEEMAAALVHSLNTFPGVAFQSGPAHWGGRNIYLAGAHIGCAVTVQWAQTAVDAMNADYQAGRVAARVEADSAESGAVGGGSQ